MTRQELFATMSSSEMTDWMALWIIRADEREKQQREDKLNRR